MGIINSLTTATPTMKVEIMDVPELGDGAQIVLKEFDADSASDFNFELVKNNKSDSAKTASKVSARGPLRFYAMLICCSAVDESGNRISNVDEADLIMSRWPRDLILRVGEKAASINGFTSEAKDEAKKDLPLNQQPQ